MTLKTSHLWLFKNVTILFPVFDNRFQDGHWQFRNVELNKLQRINIWKTKIIKLRKNYRILMIFYARFHFWSYLFILLLWLLYGDQNKVGGVSGKYEMTADRKRLYSSVFLASFIIFSCLFTSFFSSTWSYYVRGKSFSDLIISSSPLTFLFCSSEIAGCFFSSVVTWQQSYILLVLRDPGIRLFSSWLQN